MIYIGVDPGKLGGYAYIIDGVAKAFPWDDAFFVQDMYCLSKMRDEKLVAAVEKVGAVHGNGIVSMFNFGKNAGYIEGVLTALGIPYQLVPPAKWKKDFSLIGKDKKASIETCHKLFPELDLRRTELCKTDSDGKAEAALISLYAKRHFGEGKDC